MKKMIKYVIADILRSRIIIAYTVFLLAISIGVFSLEDNTSKGLLSLLNVILFVVPLVSLVFSTIYVYNSGEFIELLVSQPLPRRTIWLSMFAGLSGSLSLAFLIGAGIPIALYTLDTTGLIMIVCGCLLSVIFVSIALWGAVKIRDKAKGIGLAILLWLYFALLFDGLVLILLFQFSDYPIEQFMVGIAAFNPIDLSRILILLQLDVSAMLGYTGAIFKQFFGTFTGMTLTLFIMLLWSVLPTWFSLKQFNRKDL